MKNFICEGRTIDHAPSAQRLSGAATLIGLWLGVAASDVAANVSGVFYIDGVFDLPKLSTDVVAQGVALYWDDTNRRLTVTASGNTLVGKAYAAAGNGVATVQIAIND